MASTIVAHHRADPFGNAARFNLAVTQAINGMAAVEMVGFAGLSLARVLGS